MKGTITYDRPGAEIPALPKTMTRETIEAFARFSGDFNPIHVDEEFARKAGLGGTIAHGAISLGYFCRMLVGFFGEGWLEDGGVSLTFIAPVRPGHELKYRGMVKEVEQIEERRRLLLEIWCENQEGDKLIVGRATGVLKNQS